MTKQRNIILIFLISVNFIFINLTQVNLAAAQDLFGAGQYRFSESGSFHNSRWVEANYYVQTPDGNIYFQVSPYRIKDPETQICHLLYNQTEKCVDLSDQLDSILPNGSFEDITVDQNNNIYMTYTNLNYSAVAVFKINPSDLSVTKTWKYTASIDTFPAIGGQRSFVQNNVLYLSIMNLANIYGPLSFAYIDLNDPNSQIQIMPYADCPGGGQTCQMVVKDFKVAKNDNGQAILVLFYSSGVDNETNVLISSVSDKQVTSSYTMNNLAGSDNTIIGAFLDSNNDLVFIDRSNSIFYFNISDKKSISLIKKLDTPFVNNIFSVPDNYGNVYLSGISDISSLQQIVYRITSKGQFIKVQADPKYMVFQLAKFPDGCVYATTTILENNDYLPTDLLKSCNSDSFDYVDTFDIAQRLQVGAYFVDNKTSAMPDVILISYNPFARPTPPYQNNWVKLVYNQAPSPTPEPTISPTPPSPNPSPYPDTGFNLLFLISLFLILAISGISLSICRKKIN